MSKKKIIITIDGPSGVGKGTVAKQVAEQLGFSYLDTGAMYRAVALKISNSNINFNSDIELISVLDSTKIIFSKDKVFLDSKDVSNDIRTEKISNLSSKLATKKIVRDFLVKLQRKIGESGNIVVEGRDMGTYVFPNADFKFYLDANLEERTKRRYLQIKDKDKSIDLQTLKKDIKKRDSQDSQRKESPLHPAMNAVIINTSDMGKSEVVREILLRIGGSFK